MKFESLDRNGPINPTWYRVRINFETKNPFELCEVRRMLEGENGAVDFNRLIPRPKDEDMVEFLTDKEYAALSPAEKAEYDRAEAENRIGTCWELDNWGCAINADDAKWIGLSTLVFDVTNGIPEYVLKELSRKAHVSFNGYAIPNKFFKRASIFSSEYGKIEFDTPNNVPEMICEVWDISREEMESVLGIKKRMLRNKLTGEIIEDNPYVPPKVVSAPHSQPKVVFTPPAQPKVVVRKQPQKSFFDLPTYEDGLLTKAFKLLEKLFAK
jgi:hypothetical protein